jgi:hypothetical protein
MLTPLRFGTAPAFVRHATGQSRWTLPLHYYGFTFASILCAAVCAVGAAQHGEV